MSYETMRNLICTELKSQFNADQIERIMATVDAAAKDYEIVLRSHDLIVYGTIPQEVKMYIASKSVQNLSSGTLKLYWSRLNTFFSEIRKPLRAVTTNDIRVFLHQYREKMHVCSATIDHVRICLNGFFEWCAEELYIDRNPCRQIKKTKLPKTNRKALNQYELEKLRAACITDRETALVDFLVSSGLRVTECADLLIEDINFSDRSVRVRHGKGDKERTTFFSPKAELTLRKYLSGRTDADPHLFVSGRRPYGKLSKESIEKLVRKIYARTDIRVTVTPHILRYTFATHLLGRGTPLEQVQQLLGHESPQTTLIYAQIDMQDIHLNHQKYAV